MNTREEKITAVKNLLEVMGLSVEDLLENKVNSSQDAPQDAPKFLDIQKINGVPCMYLFYNKKTQRNEWLCLEVPSLPKMNWEKGREWCQSKGGDYGEISTLKFISEQMYEINQVLETKGYPLIKWYWHWSSIKNGNCSSWELNMINADIYNSNKNNGAYVRAFVTTE